MDDAINFLNGVLHHVVLRSDEEDLERINQASGIAWNDLPHLEQVAVETLILGGLKATDPIFTKWQRRRVLLTLCIHLEYDKGCFNFADWLWGHNSVRLCVVAAEEYRRAACNGCVDFKGA